MSVIVRCLKQNKIFLFTKGAEDSIFSLCDGANINQFHDAINKFAHNGWRTLALAFKEIDANDFDVYHRILTESYNDISDKRDENLRLIYETIEINLTIIGCTAVEDRLQEDVASTLVDLRRAGIKIWVLTGDKKETAINISYSCKHFSSQMQKLVLTDLSDVSQILTRLGEDLKYVKEFKSKKSFAYIIDGKTLSYVFKFQLSDKLRDICEECDAVLCCRMSPSQKAEVVKMVKTSKSKPMTCAIGDGANDVSMIQEAHIGLGIFGKEGRNAARSSDFAFGKFKHVKRALLVHGYLYYTRLCTLVLYFFYKNLAFVNCQLFYAPLTAFSVQSLYHGIYFMFYNVLFTSFPIAAFGLLEQKTKINELEINPQHYKNITKNKLLSVFQFIKWNFVGIWHSITAYYSTYLLLTDTIISISPNGDIIGEVEFGSIVFIQVLIIVHLKLFIEWKAINLFTLFSYLMSLFTFIVWTLIPNSFIIKYPFTTITEEQSFYWVQFKILSYPSVWLCFVLSSSIAIIPDILINFFENVFLNKKEKFENEKSDELKVPPSPKQTQRKSLKRNKSINWKASNENISGIKKRDIIEDFFIMDSLDNIDINIDQAKTVKENSSSDAKVFRYHREYRF